MSQSSKRLFGIISTVTGSKSPLIINKLSRSEKAAIAEKRDSTGKVVEREAYSVDRTVSISAITTTETPVNAGGTITVAGQTYLVDKADQNESNTDFVDISISAQTADTATLKPLSDTPTDPNTPSDPSTPDTPAAPDLSFITAGSSQILSGYIGTDQNGDPVPGSIATVTPTLSGNTFTVQRGYVADAAQLSVPVSSATLSGNVATVRKGYIPEDQILTVPEAAAPTVSGNTVIIHPGYVPAEQTIETEGGGSMEIYKCVDADGMTWWVVSGCGSTEANGRYYQGEDVKSDYGESYKIYYQQNGSCSLEYEYYDGRWTLKSGGTTLYRNDNWDYYNGDPSQCVNWMTDSGIEPVPTIAKETTTGNGWRGLLYNDETKSVSSEITPLTYEYITPKIGKSYTKNGEIACEVAVLSDYMYRQSMTTVDDLSYNGTKPTIGTFQGIPCMIFDGTGAFYKNLPTELNSKFTFSIFRYIGASNDGNAMASIGKWKRYSCIEAFQSGSFYWYPDAVRPSTATNKEQWYTQTVTYDGNRFTAYINGENVGSYSISMYAVEPILCLGSNFDSSGVPGRDRYIVGYLGDCSIWNRVLTPFEIMYNHKRMMSMVTE